MPRSSCIRCTSDGATEAAPVTATRIEDRVTPVSALLASICWKMVGGPGRTVMSSASISSTTRAGSKVAIG